MRVQSKFAAILAYSTIHMVDHRMQKMAHMMIHLVGLILGIFGVYAAFKFHDAAVVPDLMSLHSRSEERRVGKECAGLCRSRWSPYH